MLEVKNLTKHYGNIHALSDVTFTADNGEIVGLLGPNGAGKSTTMNIVTGYIPATDGSVNINGFDMDKQPKEAKKLIGYLPELPPLYMDMTVSEYLNFVAQLKQVDKKDIEGQVNAALEKAKIDHVKGRLIKNLSKGYKQRVGVAQAIIGHPDVIILDEPTVGLDPKQIQEMRKLIKDLGKEHTVILSTHILSEASLLCDKIVIINEGSVVAIDTPDNLSKKFGKSSKLVIKVEGETDKIKEVLSTIDGIDDIYQGNSHEEGIAMFTIVPKGEDIRKDVFYTLAENKLPILEMKYESLTLEEVFMQVTGGKK